MSVVAADAVSAEGTFRLSTGWETEGAGEGGGVISSAAGVDEASVALQLFSTLCLFAGAPLPQSVASLFRGDAFRETMGESTVAFTVKLALDSTARLVLALFTSLSWEESISVEVTPLRIGMEWKLELLLLALRMRE